MSRTVYFGLMVTWRPYVCTVCGHEQEVKTNHTDNCSDICKGCSWKPSSGPGHQIPALGGHTYRIFKYAGEKPPETENNPHSQQLTAQRDD